ncbi:hypothetical protein SAMN02745181_0340 [Rubritalea squalenifaciens DSM 18772]|uniref:Uncharacterized protein n=1 Tax=Rubritalea squalenifaciens DSM 18772 TaxID=1123071 RepID=A0A1M6BYQ8_9BACT|nr:hypothetical protein [Rubritalea squalenifaciens]SHI53721.1 hypothetical protein SAMN02745181_0340 [Rubritalea squalenifaciens DSM 18772]
MRLLRIILGSILGLLICIVAFFFLSDLRSEAAAERALSIKSLDQIEANYGAPNGLDSSSFGQLYIDFITEEEIRQGITISIYNVQDMPQIYLAVKIDPKTQSYLDSNIIYP